MQERKVKKHECSLSEEDIYRRRLILEDAIIKFHSNLLMDIRVYLNKFNLKNLLGEAEEILSQVKITALRNAGNYNPDCSAKAWLRKAAFYLVQHFYRAEKNRIQADSINEIAYKFGFVGDTNETSEGELFDYLRKKSVKTFFQEISADEILSVVDENDRKILKMRFINGLNTKEIAANLGISEGQPMFVYAVQKIDYGRSF